jgi:uncharacterized membrane protein YbhN (UPF0104 family)
MASAIHVKRPNGLFIVQATVTVALLVLLFRGFDWRALAEIARRLPPLFYITSFGAVAAAQLLYAFRWHTVLRGMGLVVPFGDVLRQYFVGMFFGNLMPTAVGGDAAKVFYLGRTVGYVEAGASVLVDRFLGFAWLSLLGAALAWVIGGDSALLQLNRMLLTAFAAGFVVALALLWLVPIDRLVPSFARTPRFAGAIDTVLRLAGHLKAGCCQPATLIVSGIVVLAYIVLLSLIYTSYFSVSTAGAPGMLPTMAVLVSTAVFVNVPLSVGGVGLREQLHFLLFGELGVAKETSVSLSLLVYSYSLVLSLIGYALWLRLKPAAQPAAP